MSAVRILAGTKKGAFILTSDGKRGQWERFLFICRIVPREALQPWAAGIIGPKLAPPRPVYVCPPRIQEPTLHARSLAIRCPWE